MQSVKMSKNSLLEILQINRDNHVKEFNLASVSFREQAIKIMSANLNEAKSGGELKLSVYLSQPVLHEDSYNKVIRMLELSVDDTIELTQEEFEQYVQDQWRWKQQFTNAVQMYNRIGKHYDSHGQQ